MTQDVNTRNAKTLEKCGFLAILAMLAAGTFFGLLGVILAHFLMTYYEYYYLILAFPILMALLLGFGLSLGARLGRCTCLKLPAAFVALLFSILCYGLLLFLNDYATTQNPKPADVVAEYRLIAQDTQNWLSTLPYVAEYLKPMTDAKAEENLGARFVAFGKKLPTLAQETPVVLGTIFDIALFAPVKEYLIYPGVSKWDTAKKGLVVESNLVTTWVRWTTEFLIVFLIALLMTRRGTKKAYRRQRERLEKTGVPLNLAKTKPAKAKKEDRKKSKTEPVDESLEAAPQISAKEQESAPAEPKSKKKRFKFFWGKKKAKAPVEEDTAMTEPSPAAKTGAAALDMEFPEDQAAPQYALILQQYNPAREKDLLLLIQNVGQVPEDKARKLLKVPSLLKRDLSVQDARMAIEKFNQVQAQVKLITMEQLLDIQRKQQQAAQPAPAPASRPTPPPLPATAPRPTTPPPSQPAPAGERYALILRKFDPAQRKPILELLSSLSGKSVAQLQQTLKPPALILRDASKDEVMMIAQQFQALQAEVKSLTMAELEKLMAKK